MTSENERRIERLKNALPEYEDSKRAEHTLGVFRECQWMTRVFSLDEEDTYSLLAAALLHDITKSKTDAEQLMLIRQYGIRLCEEAESVLPTLHQYTAAPFALSVFGREVVNDKVVSAISCHTTGKKGMTAIDKMLFTADFTEPGRKYRSCGEIREYLHAGCEKINKNDKAALTHLLDDITKRIIGFTVTYLIEKGRKIDTEMLSAWNDMV